MPSQYDNTTSALNIRSSRQWPRGKNTRRQALAARRAAFARGRISLLATKRKGSQALQKPKPSRQLPLNLIPAGYDPEMLYVECGRCGAPVIWPEGKATTLLKHAGIDPLELDSACILVTDACPACGSKDEYSVRIYRIAANGAMGLPPTHGNA